MKLFRVCTEYDGKSIKDSGTTRTELLREEILYAAETMTDVWEAIEWMRLDPERTLIALVEEAPAITVLTPNQLSCAAPGRTRK